MKLYSLSVLYKGATKANLLKAAYDLSSFSFFQRSRWALLTADYRLVPNNYRLWNVSYSIYFLDIYKYIFLKIQYT